MKITWLNEIRTRGASFGFRVHNEGIRAGLEATGRVEFVTPERADVAVFVGRPDAFQAAAGVHSILFTATEMSAPTTWSDEIAEAAAVVVPCRFSARVVRDWYGGPVHVCPLGVDPDLFPFIERKPPRIDEPFRFLFCGTTDPRKGVNSLFDAWAAWFASGTMPRNVQLILKVSDREKAVSYFSGSYINGLPVGLAPSNRPEFPGIIIDGRDLTAQDLAELYEISHAFITASRGEGWGLPITDAMASGLPAILPAHSAFLDYADDTVAFMIPPEDMEPAEFGASPDALSTGPIVGTRPRGVAPFVERMAAIYHDYPAALARGRRAAERMQSFTWAAAGRRFLDILEAVLGETRAA